MEETTSLGMVGETQLRTAVDAEAPLDQPTERSAGGERAGQLAQTVSRYLWTKLTATAPWPTAEATRRTTP